SMSPLCHWNATPRGTQFVRSAIFFLPDVSGPCWTLGFRIVLRRTPFWAPRPEGDRVPTGSAYARSEYRRLPPPAAPWCRRSKTRHNLICHYLCFLPRFLRTPCQFNRIQCPPKHFHMP